MNHIGNYAFNYCKKLKSITISGSVTDIGHHAFNSCEGLTSITIPDSVIWIGIAAFRDCTGLESILVDENNPDYSSDGVALYNKNKTKLILFPGAVTSLTIPDSVTSIGISAFSGCTSLTSITLPGSVTSIGDSALAFCTSLESITFTGTAEQWNAISKERQWKTKVPATEVVCSDETVAIG